jgi:nucleoside-diphosphate-sugar epimerase
LTFFWQACNCILHNRLLTILIYGKNLSRWYNEGNFFLLVEPSEHMNILIIGGTRNMGPILVHALLKAGHQVTILNRGKTRDDLPEAVERLRADRTDATQLTNALQGRTFDAVIDNALYNGREADAIIRLLQGRTGHYIFISSGQVYLVREGAERPFVEDSYEGRLMPPPKPTTFSYEEWQYGMEKRQAEDALAKAWQEAAFPFTSLRLPMVNSERDHFNRLYNYVLRIKDGGPVLVPTTPNFALRHVYAGDVIEAICTLLDTGLGKGRAYNIAQDETTSLDDFLAIVGELAGAQPHLIRVKRDLLEANGFLPDCSPFSERWMSELDNRRSKDELGMDYTPLRTYLSNIIRYYEETEPPQPVSYRRRHAEKRFALQLVQEQ